MASWWNNTRPDILYYLSSLAALSGANGAHIEVVSVAVIVSLPLSKINNDSLFAMDQNHHVMDHQM